MVVTYIDFELVGEKTQEVFNKCVARAKRIVTADHEEIAKVRVVSADYDNDNMELVRVYCEYDEKTDTEIVAVDYEDSRLPMFGLVKPKIGESHEHVWVVSFNQVWDCEELSNDSRVYANKEDAIKFFKEITKDEKKSIDAQIGDNIDEWELEENLSEKYGIGTWEYYLNGDANSNHSYVYLDVKEIRTY